MAKLFIESNQTYPAILVSSAPSIEGFYDGSSMGNWDRYKNLTYLSFSQVRAEIKAILISIVQPNYSLWNNLTAEEKAIACKYCIAPYALRVSIVGENADHSNWHNLLVETIQDRRLIIELMRREIGEDLRKELISNSDSNQFYIDSRDRLMEYEFTMNPSFYYWLTSTNGYESTGFTSKPYYSTDRLSRLLGIYNGGY
jgi:hypothetical protein